MQRAVPRSARSRASGIFPPHLPRRGGGLLKLLMEEIPEAQRDKLKEAVRLCPRQALRLEG